MVKDLRSSTEGAILFERKKEKNEKRGARGCLVSGAQYSGRGKGVRTCAKEEPNAYLVENVFVGIKISLCANTKEIK